MEESVEESERLVPSAELRKPREEVDEVRRKVEVDAETAKPVDGEDKGAVEGEENKQAEESGGDGVGIINKLISNLPSVSIPDDATPSADEASLLISMIHD